MSFDALTKTHYRLLLGVVLLSLVIVGTIFFLPNEAEMPAYDTASSTPAAAMTEAEPVVLSIPKINLEATFEEPLGVLEDGSIQVPRGYDEVGWYKYGPTPGELGPAVILGHVDSFKGPAVFFSLGQLEIGDEISITRADGSAATFAVTELERNEQTSFPTEKVYGNLDHAGLRLVTCSGTFDKGQQRYSHNLIVYAKLVE